MSQKSKAYDMRAKNKYFVLSKSQNTYKEIRSYLKNEKIDIKKLEDLIRKASLLDEDRGQVINAASHIWGYFKDKAEDKEKTTYLDLLSAYKDEKIEAKDLFYFLKKMLNLYPNTYLENSTIFKEYGL